MGDITVGEPTQTTAAAPPPVDSYLDKLLRRQDQHVQAIDEIVDRARSDRDRDLTDQENAEVDEHAAAVEALKPQIDRWDQLQAPPRPARGAGARLPALGSHSDSAAVVERVRFGAAGTPLDGMSSGEILKLVIRAHQGEIVAREMVHRALAQVTTVQTPGLLPTVALTDLMIGKINAVRPVVESSNQVQLPVSGMEFKVPRIKQHTKVDAQTAEKTEVASRALQVEFDTYMIKTYAGAVNMSVQEIERTDPSALTLVYEDLAAQYGIRTETAISEALVSGAAGTGALDPITIPADASADAISAAIFKGAAAIYAANAGEMPDTIWAATDQWARLGGFVKAVNPENGQITGNPLTLRMTAAGVKVVAGPQLSAGTLILGTSRYLLAAEHPDAPVQMKAQEVGILGYEVGVYGLFVGAVTKPSAFQRFTTA